MSKTVLISIHPEFVDKILSGEKRFEFRRKFPLRDISQLLIYSTAPVQCIVAVVAVTTVHSGCPEKLWRMTYRSSGISKSHYQQYFDGCEVAHAIELGRVHKLILPKPLSTVCPSLVAPQSYRYVDDSMLVKLHTSL